MEYKKKVSVIIPVYNTEKYLRRCLDRVCNQTLSDIEIICINDCSTDNSLEILKEYSAKDERIKVIDFKENKGAAVARNIGIEEAQGEYIGFVDSDDYPETLDFYKKLYSKSLETNADIVKGAYKNSNNNYVDIFINRKIKEDKNNFCSTYCSAIFKSKLIKENNIRFPEIRDMEDPVFSFECALKANAIEVIEDLFLIITKRKESITSSMPTLKQIQDKFDGLSMLFDLDKNINHTYVLAYWLNTVILDSLRNQSCEVKELINENCQKYIPILTENFALRNECSQYHCKILSNLVLKALVDKHDVISFDIFDTLLLRPFKEPTELFEFMKQFTQTPHNFYNDRITAENAARFFNQRAKTGNEDITYDAIYKNLEKKYPGFKELELDIEFQTLQKNKEIAEIYDYALSKNKKIIVTSDMYLPSSFLTKVLNTKGYNSFSKLYVSSETKVCKGSGKMFDFVINDLNIQPNQILHIGDNLISDVQQPTKKGISAYYYRQIKNNYPPTESALNILIKHNQNFNGNYWQMWAFNIGGPLLISFLQNIKKTVQERQLTDLFFVARDGYIIKKAYEMLYPNENIKTHYIYASRKLAKIYDKMPIDAINNEYSKYANSIQLNGNKIGIVDTCAGAFSAQNLIEKYWVGNSFIGIYLAAFLNHKYNYINLSFKEHKDAQIGFKWDIIETFFTSPEPPIEGMKDCKPVYREEINEADIFVINIYKDLEFGLLEYIKQVKSICNNYIVQNFEVNKIFENLREYWENLSTEDIEMLDNIKHPINTSQTQYLSLVSDKQ